MHNLKFGLGFLICCILFSACSPKNNSVRITAQISPTIILPSPSPVTTSPSDQEKMCNWVDKSDIIVQVKFADNLVEKDSSYEVGFATSPLKSTRRLARKICDYKTGFKYDEFKKAGITQMLVIGYTDNERRRIKGDPVTVVFNDSGIPDVGNNIDVEILD